MERSIELAEIKHMESIKNHKCPDCGSILERAASPGGTISAGGLHPYEYWDFYCINEDCQKVWRVPRARYEAAFGEWPE
jgi:hypothetical protein